MEIRGAIGLQTTFRVDQQITRRCYEVSLKIGGWGVDPKTVGIGLQSNIHLLELNLRQTKEVERPQLVDDLKEIQISQRSTETTRIGAGLGHKEEK
ncbi:hypothetical protein CR513_25151, partial [Mucuna pruriens]